jgi:hypothetical protein
VNFRCMDREFGKSCKFAIVVIWRIVGTTELEVPEKKDI